MAEKHVHKVYGSFPPWGKSVEFPANGGGGGSLLYGPYHRWSAEPSTYAALARMVYDETIVIMPYRQARNVVQSKPDIAAITCIALDPTWKLFNLSMGGKIEFSGDLLSEKGIDTSLMKEDEFYDETPRFWIILDQLGPRDNMASDDRWCHYEIGMSWNEWVNSDFNTIGLIIDNEGNVGYPPIEGRGVFLLKSMDSSSNAPLKSEDVVKGVYRYYIQEQV